MHAGDLLAQIDPDPFRAALEQAMAKKGQDEAQLANARVDLKRYAELLANEGVTQQQYDTQKALVNHLVATVNADQAAIESAKVQLAYTTIVSPIDGRTGIRLVDQGNIVHASDLNGIVVITQLKPISVVFILPEQTLRPDPAADARGPTPTSPSWRSARITRTCWARASSPSLTIKLIPPAPRSNSRRRFPIPICGSGRASSSMPACC